MSRSVTIPRLAALLFLALLAVWLMYPKMDFYDEKPNKGTPPWNNNPSKPNWALTVTGAAKQSNKPANFVAGYPASDFWKDPSKGCRFGTRQPRANGKWKCPPWSYDTGMDWGVTGNESMDTKQCTWQKKCAFSIARAHGLKRIVQQRK